MHLQNTTLIKWLTIHLAQVCIIFLPYGLSYLPSDYSIDNFTVFLQYWFLDELSENHKDHTLSEIIDSCVVFQCFVCFLQSPDSRQSWNCMVIDKLEFWYALQSTGNCIWKSFCNCCCRSLSNTSSVQFLTLSTTAFKLAFQIFTRRALVSAFSRSDFSIN